MFNSKKKQAQRDALAFQNACADIREIARQIAREFVQLHDAKHEEMAYKSAAMQLVEGVPLEDVRVVLPPDGPDYIKMILQSYCVVQRGFNAATTKDAKKIFEELETILGPVWRRERIEISRKVDDQAMHNLFVEHLIKGSHCQVSGCDTGKRAVDYVVRPDTPRGKVAGNVWYVCDEHLDLDLKPYRNF